MWPVSGLTIITSTPSEWLGNPHPTRVIVSLEVDALLSPPEESSIVISFTISTWPTSSDFFVTINCCNPPEHTNTVCSASPYVGMITPCFKP